MGGVGYWGPQPNTESGSSYPRAETTPANTNQQAPHIPELKQHQPTGSSDPKAEKYFVVGGGKNAIYRCWMSQAWDGEGDPYDAHIGQVQA